jgi:hypothetical protein
MNCPRGNVVALILGLSALLPNIPRAQELQLAQAPPHHGHAQDRARAAAQQQQAARAAQQHAQQQAARAAQQQARAAAQQKQAAHAAQQQAARAAAQQQHQAQVQARAAARAAQLQRQPQEQAARAAQQQRQAQERAAQQQRQAQEQAARAAQQRQQAQEQARAAQERARAAQQQQQQRQAQERARLEQQRREAEQQRARAAAEQQRANERNQDLQKQRLELEAVERRRAEEQRRAGEQGRVPERFGQRPQPGTRQPVAVRHEQLRQERVKLSGDQRHHLRQAFPVNRDRIARVQFARQVGTRIPRSVRLFVVPAAVLAIFPFYRDYRYVVEDDTICIVDPDTYEIVDVLDEEPYIPDLRPPVAALTLSDSEAAFVLSSIPPDFPQAQLRLRLALGVEIPARVELYEFAPMVLDRIPKLADFRFVVTEDQLVVVAPPDRSVALVLDR